jgi:predicted enzyme related to lactoylglutathione lyase
MTTLLASLTLAAAAAAPAPAETAPSLKLSVVTVMVDDQDAALRFYTEVLGLEKRSEQRSGTMRWLTVAPKGQKYPEIVLLAADASKRAQVGQGTTWVFDTDDCRGMYETLRARGVKFLAEPQETPWGIQAIFVDLYGNPYALIQPGPQRPY